MKEEDIEGELVKRGTSGRLILKEVVDKLPPLSSS